MAFRVQPDRAVAKEITRILQEQIARAIGAAGDGQHPAAERARRARVACKKIRATLQLVRCHAPKRFKREGRCFRDAARRLADIREQSAVLATLESLHRGAPYVQRIDRRSRLRIREAFIAQNRLDREASRQGDATLQTFRLKIGKAGARLEHLRIKGPKQDGFAYIKAGFHRSYARARTALSEATPSAHVEALHTWRKRTKTHLNQCRLLECICPGIMPSRIRELKRLASKLGDHHDLTVLGERISSTDFAPRDQRSVDAIQKEIAARLSALQSASLAMGETLFSEKPRALDSRVETEWNAARPSATQRP